MKIGTHYGGHQASTVTKTANTGHLFSHSISIDLGAGTLGGALTGPLLQ